MTKSRRRAQLLSLRLVSFGSVAGLAIGATLGTPVHAAEDATDVPDQHARCAALREAKPGLEHRLLVTAELERVQYMPAGELAHWIEVQIDEIDEHGADGLESLLLSSLAAHAARPDVEASAHEELVVAALGAWWTAKEPLPHAYQPVARPGIPAALHVRTGTVRSVLQTMLIVPGVTSIDAAFEHDICSPEGLDAIETQYGGDMRSEVEELCAELGAGGSWTGMPGLPDAMSALDCMFEHESTRAERFVEMMRDCGESIAEGGGGNPFADGAGAPAPGGGAPPPPAEPPAATLKPDGVYDVEIVYNRYALSDDGQTRTVEHVHADGTSSTYSDPNEDAIFANMEAGDEKMIVFQRIMGKPAAMPGDESSMTPECEELWQGIRGLDDDWTDGENLDPLINPGTSDTAPVEEGDDCWGLLETEVDEAVGCIDEFVDCGPIMIPDGDCTCVPPKDGVSVDGMCGLSMMCTDGQQPDENCRCSESGAIVLFPEVPDGDGDPLPVDPFRLDAHPGDG